MKRDVTITINFSALERDTLKRVSALVGQNMSAFIREAAIDMAGLCRVNWHEVPRTYYKHMQPGDPVRVCGSGEDLERDGVKGSVKSADEDGVIIYYEANDGLLKFPNEEYLLYA